MKTPLCASSLVLLAGCATGGGEPAPLPTWAFAPAMVFPADRSLARPEDGVALADGQLLVADQAHGLRVVAADGASRPFGDLAGAGYVHAPPARAGAANGVTLEPDGTHVLVADVFGGGIYRVGLADGQTTRVHQHRFGVNTARRDSTGAIWFTQSTENAPDQAEVRMFAAVDRPVADGALWRLPCRDGRFAPEAELVVGGLHFANGLAIDEARGLLFLSEMGRDRILRFRLDVAAGQLTDRTTLLEVPLPDNLELDRHGRLWVVLPMCNELLAVNPRTGQAHSAFRAHTAAQAQTLAEFVRRGKAGESRLALFTPAVWAPLPGAITGVILGADGPLCLTGLGDALVSLR